MAQTMQLNQFNQTPLLGNSATKVNLNTLPVTIDPNSVNTLVPGDAVYMTTTTSNQIYVDKWASGLGPIFGYVMYSVKGATSGVTVNNNGFTANNQIEIGLGGTIMFGQAGSTISRGQFLEYQPNVIATGPQMIPSAGINPVSAIALDNASSTGIFRFMVLDIAEQLQNSVYALTSAASIAISQLNGETQTLTPTQSLTLNAATVVPNKRLYFIITTSGTTAFTITFGTNFKSTGTLSTGGTSGKVFTICFDGDGVNYNELSRTTAM